MGSSSIVNRIETCEYVVPRVLTKTVAAIATPEAIAPASPPIFFRKATVIGNKAARTANAGIVYFGTGSGNDTQAFALAAGAVIYINAPVGCKMNFADWWVDVATAADGVTIIYT